MGYLKSLKIMGRAPDGTCPECAVKYLATNPHDKNSLFYQYRFYDQHGRWPTWGDAMAHCTPEVQKVWTEELEKLGEAVSKIKMEDIR